MNSRKILWFLIVPFILMVVSIVMSIINECISDYFVIPLYAIINIVIAIYFAYYLNQKNAFKNKKRDYLEHFINKILCDLNDNRIVCINNDEALDYVRIFQRTFKNRITMLKRYCKELINDDDLQYIEDNFNNYWYSVSENIYDIEKLRDLDHILKNYISIINNRLEKIIFELYQ